MTFYRVVNEILFNEGEFTLFSAAKAFADKLRKERGDKEHFRVEETTIVYHTAEKMEKKE